METNGDFMVLIRSITESEAPSETEVPAAASEELFHHKGASANSG
jgi:hypothetical protein